MSPYLRKLSEAKKKEIRVISALTEPQFVGFNHDFFAVQKDCFYEDWTSLVDAMILSTHCNE
ncbi:MAG: hypothetical protein DYG95_29390 [Chlorobi bacterium CHB1]|nr:hypothetical protein [Chlorobi bacterium CHB1]